MLKRGISPKMTLKPESRGDTEKVAIGFFKNFSVDPLEKVQLLLEGGPYGPL